MNREDETDERRPTDWEDARDEERAREGGHVGGAVPLAAEAPRPSYAPRAYQRADHRIRDDIYDALCGDTGADASDVIVAVHGGAVTLTGAVPEPEDERRVVRIAERVAGVRRVVNYLRVLAPT